MKKKQTKAQKINYQKYFPLVIFISVLFMSIGYAVINSVILNLEGEVIAKNQSGLFITETKYKNNNNADINSSDIKVPAGTTLNSTIHLSSSDSTSSITYTITIYNSTNLNYAFDKATYDNSFYDNQNIIFELNGLTSDTIIAPQNYLSFDITFKYQSPTITNNILNSYINFDFILAPTIIAQYDYTGTYEVFTAPYDGAYKIELWGAQGGIATAGEFSIRGGYGGYSTGEINLNKNEKLYITVGSQGTPGNYNSDNSEASGFIAAGGYNGGGFAGGTGRASGGGATSIYDNLIGTGLLSEYEDHKDNILMVAGGGAGGQVYKPSDATNYSGYGGSGGGFQGGDGQIFSEKVYGYGTGGTQETGGYVVKKLLPSYVDSSTYGTFGQGASVKHWYENHYVYSSGAGGGYYGGGALEHGPAGGGSGYIGSQKIFNKYMVCNACLENSNENTKTITTENYSNIPKSNMVKEGNGFVSITIIKTN